MKYSQHQKILARMCIEPSRWYLPMEFMQSGDLFVGYEASARLSELRRECPQMLQVRKEGKYLATKLDMENIANWWQMIPKDYRQVIYKYTGYTPYRIVED